MADVNSVPIPCSDSEPSATGPTPWPDGNAGGLPASFYTTPGEQLATDTLNPPGDFPHLPTVYPGYWRKAPPAVVTGGSLDHR